MVNVFVREMVLCVRQWRNEAKYRRQSGSGKKKWACESVSRKLTISKYTYPLPNLVRILPDDAERRWPHLSFQVTFDNSHRMRLQGSEVQGPGDEALEVAAMSISTF